MPRKFTREKLAELVGLNIRTIQKIKAGQADILLTTGLRLQKAPGRRWIEFDGVSRNCLVWLNAR